MASVALYALMTPKCVTLLIYSNAFLDEALGLNVKSLCFPKMTATVFPILFIQYKFDTSHQVVEGITLPIETGGFGGNFN